VTKSNPFTSALQSGVRAEASALLPGFLDLLSTHLPGGPPPTLRSFAGDLLEAQALQAAAVKLHDLPEVAFWAAVVLSHQLALDAIAAGLNYQAALDRETARDAFLRDILGGAMSLAIKAATAALIAAA
jgi:hypothetical protein